LLPLPLQISCVLVTSDGASWPLPSLSKPEVTTTPPLGQLLSGPTVLAAVSEVVPAGPRLPGWPGAPELGPLLAHPATVKKPAAANKIGENRII
jgi:hypothetical protein